jgi:hypothetical protein
VADLLDGAAEEQIANEAMTVRGHGDEVAIFVAGGVEDFAGRIAEGEFDGDGDAFGAKLSCGVLEVPAVVFHLLGFGEAEAIVVAGDPAIGDMDEKELRAEEFGKVRDVGQQSAIGTAVFEGDKNFAVHGGESAGAGQAKEAVNGSQNGCRQKCIEKELYVEGDDDRGAEPAEDLDPKRVDEFAHFGFFAGEAHKRPDSEAELHAETNLAGDEQVGAPAFAEIANDANGRDDSNGTGDETAQPGAQTNVEKALHDDLARERAGEGGVLAGGQECKGKKSARDADAESGAEEFVGILDFGDVVVTGPVKSSSGEHEKRAVDKEREHQGGRGIDGGVFDGFAPAFRIQLVFAGLNNGGMQVKVVGHDGRAKNSNADVEHLLVFKDVDAGHESEQHAGKAGFGEKQFEGEAGADGNDQRDDESFDIAEAFVLEIENSKDIQAGNHATPDERNAEEELEPDGRTDNFGEIARSDRDFAKNPKEPNNGRGVVIAASLGEIAARDDAKLDAEMLEQNRHQIRHHDDEEEGVAELGAAGKVGGPVAGVHITDGDEESGAGVSPHFFPEREMTRNGDGAMDLGKTDGGRGSSPCEVGRDRWRRRVGFQVGGGGLGRGLHLKRLWTGRTVGWPRGMKSETRHLVSGPD